MQGMIYRAAIAVKEAGERWGSSTLIRVGLALGDFARSLRAHGRATDGAAHEPPQGQAGDPGAFSPDAAGRKRSGRESLAGPGRFRSV